MATTAAPTKAQVLTLLRNLLRTARLFSDYNVRNYVKRRTLDSFRQNSSLSDPVSITAAYADGVLQLEVAQRQSVVYSFFHPKQKSMLDMDQNYKQINNNNIHDVLN